MNLDNFKKGIEDIKAQKLSSSERDLLTQNLDKYVLSHPVKYKELKSPWYPSTLHFILSARGGLVLSVLILTFASSGSFFLAKNSLPGDTFYPLKVDVVEPLEYSFAVDSVSKTNILLNNLDTRLKEAEALDAGGKLTVLVQSDLENRLKINTEKILEITSKKREGNNVEPVATLKTTSDTRVQQGPEVMMMMVSSSVSTSTATSTDSGVAQESQRDRIIRSTKETIERIKKRKISNARLIDVAEESIRKAEDSIKDIDGGRVYLNNH